MKIYSISLVTKEMQFKVVYELKVKKKKLRKLQQDIPTQVLEWLK